MPDELGNGERRNLLLNQRLQEIRLFSSHPNKVTLGLWNVFDLSDSFLPSDFIAQAYLLIMQVNSTE